MTDCLMTGFLMTGPQMTGSPMTGPYDRPPAPATEPTDTPAPLPERLPGAEDTGPVMDPPVNPDLPGLPEPSPTPNPDTPGLPSPGLPSPGLPSPVPAM